MSRYGNPFGEKAAWYLEQKGVKQIQLASHIGVDKAVISHAMRLESYTGSATLKKIIVGMAELGCFASIEEACELILLLPSDKFSNEAITSIVSKVQMALKGSSLPQTTPSLKFPIEITSDEIDALKHLQQCGYSHTKMQAFKKAPSFTQIAREELEQFDLGKTAEALELITGLLDKIMGS